MLKLKFQYKQAVNNHTKDGIRKQNPHLRMCIKKKFSTQ